MLFIVYTVPNVHHCYHCFKGKCCSWFEGLLSCDTLETDMHYHQNPYVRRGARWLSGRVSDSEARGPGFETYRRRVVSLSKTLYSPKVLVNYPGSDRSIPT